MKYFISFLVIAMFTFTTASASQAEKRVELDSNKIDSIWSQLGPNTLQANATVEVTQNSGESATVIFQSLEALPPGGSVYFRVVLPNGKIKSMRGYITDGSPFSLTLHDGKFPENYPVGYAHFEAMIESPQGSISYTSAYAGVRLSSIGPKYTCCHMSGPLQSAYTTEGSAIDISGGFDNVVIAASLNGQAVVPIPFGFSPRTGAPIHRIYTPNYGRRESILTVCSGGVCSTRHIYFD